MTQKQWWQDSIIYVVDVEKFYDSNNDGIGDFAGLTEKIDYIADLGVNCIWLLPFYESTHRDNGYDITDYFHVDPRQGSLDDFIAFIHAAGERGIRVIIDFVTNHTSNKHPWFEAARHDSRSRYRDYYYWSDNPPPTPPGKGTMFPGEENSVWAYDESARAYYYHRFYHFQPSLNPHNSNVREELERVVDFWMSFGVSGLRIDAAAMMVEAPAPEFQELKDPHDVLREIYQRAKLAKKDCALVGEVDVAQEKIKDFMDGKQLDMMFNFILNNHTFLALARQQAEPLIDTLEMMPRLTQEGCWVNFLRNFDEANLQRLDDKQQEEVFEHFAPREDMQIYGRGIRRRLAPMLNGNVAQLKMVYSLLFSFPGAPCLVYGDEIGMGDDLSQKGRWSVRSPMQWDDKRNAGFSAAPKGKLIQAVVDKGRFGYQNINVAREDAEQESLLNHIRSLCRLRLTLPVIRFESMSVIKNLPENVLGLCYRHDRDVVIVFHNLSDKKASFTLPPGLPGSALVDALSDEPFKTKTVSLPGYGFLWLVPDKV